jgi:hypothetical protein
MSAIWQEKWNALRAKRAQYPIQRQVLLWIRDIGLVVDVALCIGLALFASPTVLSDDHLLRTYVDFMGGYFGAVHRLSVGAIHPEVSQLVFAVGWGVAIIPFIAWFLDTVVYLLVLDRSNTKTVVEMKYNERFSRPDFLIGIAEYVGGPFMAAMAGFFTLGDLGMIRHFGWVNGVLMTKAEALRGHFIVSHMVFMHMYTSRWGLGLISSLVIYVGVVFYSAFFPFIIFIFIPIWVDHMRQRVFGKTDKS